jgi:hypothetical protein
MNKTTKDKLIKLKKLEFWNEKNRKAYIKPFKISITT